VHDGRRGFHQNVDPARSRTNATLPVSLIMVRAARDYFDRTGVQGRVQARGRYPQREAVARTGWR